MAIRRDKGSPGSIAGDRVTGVTEGVQLPATSTLGMHQILPRRPRSSLVLAGGGADPRAKKPAAFRPAGFRTDQTKMSAVTYSRPVGLPSAVWASLPCSEWERVFPQAHLPPTSDILLIRPNLSRPVEPMAPHGAPMAAAGAHCRISHLYKTTYMKPCISGRGPSTSRIASRSLSPGHKNEQERTHELGCRHPETSSVRDARQGARQLRREARLPISEPGAQATGQTA